MEERGKKGSNIEHPIRHLYWAAQAENDRPCIEIRVRFPAGLLEITV